jgi:hypothetical protein
MEARAASSQVVGIVCPGLEAAPIRNNPIRVALLRVLVWAVIGVPFSDRAAYQVIGILVAMVVVIFPGATLATLIP